MEAQVGYEGRKECERRIRYDYRRSFRRARRLESILGYSIRNEEDRRILPYTTSRRLKESDLGFEEDQEKEARMQNGSSFHAASEAFLGSNDAGEDDLRMVPRRSFGRGMEERRTLPYSSLGRGMEAASGFEDAEGEGAAMHHRSSLYSTIEANLGYNIYREEERRGLPYRRFCRYEGIKEEQRRMRRPSRFCGTEVALLGSNNGRGELMRMDHCSSFRRASEYGREERIIRHYCNFHRILLIGEGDFSFAASLATAFGSAINMVATSKDSREELMSKYTNANSNLGRLEGKGCTILHGVDCRTMASHPALAARPFDRIVYNFPHAGFVGREDDDHQILLHQKVVAGFLRNAKAMVAENGEVHVTHKACGPFNRWDIEAMASLHGLGLVEKVRFSGWDYPGYENKRGDGHRSDESFNVGLSYTFKFAPVKPLTFPFFISCL